MPGVHADAVHAEDAPNLRHERLPRSLHAVRGEHRVHVVRLDVGAVHQIVVGPRGGEVDPVRLHREGILSGGILLGGFPDDERLIDARDRAHHHRRRHSLGDLEHQQAGRAQSKREGQLARPLVPVHADGVGNVFQRFHQIAPGTNRRRGFFGRRLRPRPRLGLGVPLGGHVVLGIRLGGGHVVLGSRARVVVIRPPPRRRNPPCEQPSPWTSSPLAPLFPSR